MASNVQIPRSLSPIKTHGQTFLYPPIMENLPVSFVRRLEFNYPEKDRPLKFQKSLHSENLEKEDFDFPELQESNTQTKIEVSNNEQEQHFFFKPTSTKSMNAFEDEEDFYPLYNKNHPRYYSDSYISYNNNNHHNNCEEDVDSNGSETVCGNQKGKLLIDGVTMDFKLQVLRWAYTKTIHSAGHRFHLDRCFVRNWMLNEEKIYNSASEKGKRKWRNFDSRVMRHLGCTRPVPGKGAESSLINGIGGLSFQE